MRNVEKNNILTGLGGLGRAQLRTLGVIRWVAIAGQTVTLLVVHYGFQFDLPLELALLTVGVSAFANIIFISRAGRGNIGESNVAAIFGFDLIQLSVLLYLTGGLQNPFAFLLLAPVTVSAAILSRGSVILLSGLAISAVTILTIWHLPLPWVGTIEPFPPIYMLGVWVSLGIGVLFFAIYTYRVATEARQLSQALNATQMALAREQQVSAVGMIAAAAAHELGSPLGTIDVAVNEIARELPKDSPFSEDIELLVSEIHRCRDILAALARKPEFDRVAFSKVPLSAVVEQSSNLHRREEIELCFLILPPENRDIREPQIKPAPEILHGLGNLVQNAIQFAKKQVTIETLWDRERVTVQIYDDGPGFPQFIIDRAGEPYISGRNQAGGQMGLGIFIAQTLLERTGASLSYRNSPSGGAQVTITWRQEFLENIGTTLAHGQF